MRGTLGRTLGLVVVAVATVVGLVVLADATKFEGEIDESGVTEVQFAVDTRGYHHGLDNAATSLWNVCIGTVNWSEVSGPTAVGDGTFHAAVRPSLGEDTRRRLRGCLEDATVDKVRGHTISMDTTTDPPAAASGKSEQVREGRR